MNESPDGTPNPLNPAPMDPVGPEAPVDPMETEPMVADQMAPEQPMDGDQMASEQPMAPEEMVMTEEVTEQTMEQPVEPMDQPAEPMTDEPTEEVAVSEAVEVDQPVEIPVTPEVTEPEPVDSVVEPKKKSSKKPIIILAIILLLIAIGCGVAAVVLLNPFGKKEDPVPAAISKLITNVPTNVNINGTVVMSSDDEDLAVFQSIAVDFSSRMNVKTTENATNASITITSTDDTELTFDAEDIFTSNGDLYLKVSGVKDALYPTDCVDEDTDCVTELETETNCVGDESGETNCGVVEEECEGDDCEEVVISEGLSDIIVLLTLIDGEWIKFPSEELNSMLKGAEINTTTQCLIGAAGKLSDYSDDIKGQYNENPFIEYSTDNITITKKKDDIYRLSFNTDKMTAFINSISDSGFMSELNACNSGTETDTEVSADKLVEAVKKLSETYVEIDKDNNFTRVYLKVQSKDGMSFVTADLSFTYPTTNVTVEEPTEYTNFSELFGPLYDEAYTDDTVIEYDY